MSDQPFDLHDLFEYLDGAMDADRQAELRRWLDADPSRYALLARASFLHRAIGDAVRNEHEGGAAVQEEAAKSPDDSDAVPLLAELARLEVSARVDPIDLDERRVRAGQAALGLNEASKPGHDVSARDVVSALGYLGLKALRSKAGLMTVSAIAALLALALTLTIVLQANPTPPKRITENPAGQTTSQAVATLTATHHAQWADRPSGGLSAGTRLHAGQRLSLTEGFAEITTNDGAIVLLEAPATVELLDDDNALRLHEGKLVGVCETELSKGFIVRTPRMDITDLGTRFGVDASDRAVEVHVIEGSVQIQDPAGLDTQPRTMRLSRGQAIRVDPLRLSWLPIQAAPQQFVLGLPDGNPAYGATGLGLTHGQIDRNWTVTHANGKPLDTPEFMRVLDDERTAHLGPQKAQWIRLRTSGGARDHQLDHEYTIHARVLLPEKTRDAQALRLDFLADNVLVSLTVNGRLVEVPENDLATGGGTQSVLIDTKDLVSGANTFRFTIKDQRTTSPDVINFVGIRARWRWDTTIESSP